MNEYTWADLSVGLQQQFPVTVTADAMTAFRALSGDLNPLHCDDETARQRGYRQAVVFGLLTSSYYSTLVGVYLPGRFALLNRITVDFVAPVYVGASLIVEGEIRHLTDAYRRVEIGASIREAEGGIVSRAKIGVTLHA